MQQPDGAACQCYVHCSAVVVLADSPSGSRSATVSDLPLLVRKLRSAAPELGTVEDFLPLDPRLVVRFRARQGERHWNFRVHPGSLESPLDLLQQLANYADALDPSIQAQLGYGIGDMLDIAGDVMNQELPLLSPAWNDANVAMGSRPFVTQAEVDAAARYLRAWSADTLLPDEPPAGGRPAQLDRAARALAVPADKLSFAPGPFTPTLGPAVVIDSTAGKFPMPAGLILESLDYAVARMLAAFASPAGKPETRGYPGRSR